MDKPTSNLYFKVTILAFTLRDLLLPRRHILREVGIKPGFHVLDYGCGPGGYLILQRDIAVFGLRNRVYDTDNRVYGPRKCLSRAVVLKEIAKLVGRPGRIYALDIHPLAIQRAQDIASKNEITNLETICSECKTVLPDSSIDVVLLYDTFHLLTEPVNVLHEIHRVLKPNVCEPRRHTRIITRWHFRWRPKSLERGSL